jgi:hypothetical protein
MAESEVFAAPRLFPRLRRESPTDQRFAPANSSREELSSRAAEQQPRIVLTDEVTLLRAIPASRCGGNQRQGYLSDALPLSYGSLRYRWESNPRLSAPDVTRAFTTPQTLPYSSLLTSLPHYSSPRTPVAGPWEAHFSPPNYSDEKVREESAVTVFRGLNPSLAALPLKYP